MEDERFQKAHQDQAHMVMGTTCVDQCCTGERLDDEILRKALHFSLKAANRPCCARKGLWHIS